MPCVWHWVHNSGTRVPGKKRPKGPEGQPAAKTQVTAKARLQKLAPKVCLWQMYFMPWVKLCSLRCHWCQGKDLKISLFSLFGSREKRVWKFSCLEVAFSPIIQDMWGIGREEREWGEFPNEGPMLIHGSWPVGTLKILPDKLIRDQG